MASPSQPFGTWQDRFVEWFREYGHLYTLPNEGKGYEGPRRGSIMKAFFPGQPIWTMLAAALVMAAAAAGQGLQAGHQFKEGEGFAQVIVGTVAQALDAVFDPFAGPLLSASLPSTESQREIWTAASLGDGPRAGGVLIWSFYEDPKAERFVNGIPMVAHNASFDARFWAAETGRLGGVSRAQRPMACTLLLSRRLYPEAGSYKLGFTTSVTLTAGFIATVAGYMAGLIGASNSPISGVGILSVLGISLILAALFGSGSDDPAVTQGLVAFALFGSPRLDRRRQARQDQAKQQIREQAHAALGRHQQAPARQPVGQGRTGQAHPRAQSGDQTREPGERVPGPRRPDCARNGEGSDPPRARPPLEQTGRVGPPVRPQDNHRNAGETRGRSLPHAGGQPGYLRRGENPLLEVSGSPSD